jgi:hypothetical protein
MKPIRIFFAVTAVGEMKTFWGIRNSGEEFFFERATSPFGKK